MTEQDWLGGVRPEQMLGWLHGRLPRTPAKRKWRLLICACCRQVPGLLADPDCRRAVEVAERYADGQATKEERDETRWALLPLNPFQARHSDARRPLSRLTRVASCAGVPTADLRCVAEEVAAAVARLRTQARLGEPLRVDRVELVEKWKRFRSEERARLCDLIRCVFGNPFQSPSLDPAWLGWNGGAVQTLAGAVYEEHRFEDLPVLADALGDAGCTDAGLLSHLRGPGPHATGCFGVDTLLSKSWGR